MRGTSKLVTAVVMALSLCVGAAGMATARPGLYIGAGSATTVVPNTAGTFDGSTTFVDNTTTPTLMYLSGQLKDGGGLGYLIGFGLNRFISFEYVAANTTHKATHTLYTTALETDAVVDIGLVALRVNIPLGSRFELFVRGGSSQGTVSMNQFAGDGGTLGASYAPATMNTAVFSGSGTSVGAGVEFFMGRLGIGVSQTAHTLGFTKVTGAVSSGTIDPAMSATINQSLVTLTLNFKGSK